jgi:hypothetical protein
LDFIAMLWHLSPNALPAKPRTGAPPHFQKRCEGAMAGKTETRDNRRKPGAETPVVARFSTVVADEAGAADRQQLPRVMTVLHGTS